MEEKIKEIKEDVAEYKKVDYMLCNTIEILTDKVKKLERIVFKMTEIL